MLSSSVDLNCYC